MSRSDRSRRDAERSARRAKRIAERQKMRAERKAKEAERAARRAERLSERAAGKGRRRRTSERDIERSIEDFVDDMTEKWTRKAEDWLNGETDRSRDAGDHPEYDDNSTEKDDVTRSRYRSRREYRSRRRGSLRSRVRRGRGLYRNSQHKKICGVCAGVADYLDVDRWQVRLVAVLGLIFVPSVAVTIYFIAYLLMDDKPY
ncbi:MAG: PspC domain-containing protein, partial [Pseudomonadales bacterium]|nr:PspC domain-containing protein [Pseudomonadales bacterium]